MRSSYFNFSIFCLLVTLFALSACQRKYDEPPVTELPVLEANTTIREIINLASTSPLSLDGKVIKGTVIADDRSGNFYKQIVIQDSTGGIRIDIDAFSLYNEFPIGREVWVKGQGLYALKTNDVVAIGGSTNPNTFRIPQAVYRLSIVGGERNRPLTPKVKTLATLTAEDYNTLIQLDNVEFDDCYAGTPYAFASTQTSKNIDLVECTTNGKVIVRNSGFANFASELTPTGKGSIVAVFNSFSGTFQLLIRNPNDVSSMTGTRCTPLANYNQVSIADLRSQFTGAPVSATGKIRGIVISDASSGQWNGKNLVVQEPNGSGILVRFAANHNFAQGDYVEVKVGGGLLQRYNGGLLQVEGLPTCRAMTLPNPGNLSITPRVATVADIIANIGTWESTLIKVQGASLNGGATYGDFGVMLNDATGSISMFSRFANFGSTPLPTGTGDVTAVIGNFGGNAQLNIRNLNDVNITGGGGGGGGTLNLMSIQDVRNLFTGTSTNAPAQTKIVGIVISDLVGGNFNSRNVVIQESNGAGIVVRFDANHSYNLGEELEVNISSATINEFNNVLQVNGIPINNATVLSTGNSITPRVTTVSDITSNVNNWESTLVRVQGASVSGNNYRDYNATITDASGTMSFFNRFANFGNDPLPTGTGTVTAIVGDFTNGPQLTIRRPNLDMSGFSGGGGGGGGNPTMLTIGAVRALYTGSSTTIPASRSLSGIVISDKDAGNITGRNIVVQQSSGSGIVVRFDNNNTTVSLGDSITVDISGGTLNEFRGLLQISGIGNSNATVVSSNNSITPRVATVQDILTNQSAWESTLVVINGATITGSTTYAGGTTVTDASGSIDMFTRTSANFSSNALPTSSVNITAIVSEFNNPQINIRNANDVQ